MTNIFLTVMEISISISLLIAALLLFAPLLNKRYAAKWKYWIWVLLALRLILPFHGADVGALADSLLHAGSRSAMRSGERDVDSFPEQTVPQGRIVIGIPAQMTIPIAPPSEGSERHITPLDVTAYIWMAGCLTFVLVHLISYLHYKRQALRRGNAVTDNEILRRVFQLKRELRIKGSVRIIEYPEAASPMMIGFLEPVLILPEIRYDPVEQYFILKHELVHLKRRDVYVKLLLVAANAVHWFNPLVWIMQKEAAVDMELSCDERVTQGADHAVRKAYTETLLSTLHRGCAGRTVLSTQFYGGKQIMKKRFQNILRKTGKKNGAVILMCSLLLTVSLGTLVGCSVTNENRGAVSSQAESGSSQFSSAADAPGASNAENQASSEILAYINKFDGKTLVQINQPGSGSTEGTAGSSESGSSQSSSEADAPGTSNAGNKTSTEILAYIQKFDGTTLVFDEVEWVQVPGERAAELGLTEDDAPSGFSVYNAESVNEEMSLAGDCTCTLLDWTSNYAEMQVTTEELAEILAEREGTFIPYHLTIKENEIIGIVEQYVP